MGGRRRAAVHRRSYRWTDDEVRIFRRLAETWGGIRPLSESDVIREAARRCLAAKEEGSGEKSLDLS